MTTHSETDRELDAALAEKLFGIVVDEGLSPYIGDGETPGLNWSSTGDGMLQVIEAMEGRGYVCSMWYAEKVACFWNSNGDDWRVASSTLPRAVAEAALVALEG